MKGENLEGSGEGDGGIAANPAREFGVDLA